MSFRLTRDEYPEWDRFVYQCEEGTIYHLSSWQDFLEEAFPHIKGEIIAVRDEDSGDIIAGVPLCHVRSFLFGNRIVSTPFATLGGVLLGPSSETNGICASVLDRAIKWGGRLELRGIRKLGMISGLPLVPAKKYMHHYLELRGSIEDISAKFSRVIRRNLVKAEKARVKIGVYEEISDEMIREFSFRHQKERKRLGLPPFPLRFFTALKKHMPFSSIIISVAICNSKILGMLLTLEFQQWAISEYIAVSDLGRELGVSQFLYRESMARSIHVGRKYYSMGRTSTDNAGLIRFKRSWGATEESIGTLSYAPASPLNVNVPFLRAIEQAARFAIRSLPMPFARTLGKLIYSHWA